MSGPEPPDPPKYTKYRARPSLLRREPKSASKSASDTQARPLDALRRDAQGPEPGAPHKKRRRVTKGRVAKWVALALAAWIGLSLVLFLVSAQIEQGKIDDATNAALAGGGPPFTKPTPATGVSAAARLSSTAATMVASTAASSSPRARR